MMLTAIPKGWFSKNYRVMDGALQLADLNISRWREQGELTVEGFSYQVYREKLMSGAFILEVAGTALARAEKPSAFHRRFHIEYGDRKYVFQAKSVWGREFTLFDGHNEIGSVAPEGLLTRRAAVNLPDELALPVKVFILWLAIILWKRESDSGPAAGGNGGI
jgi:hypothetical protein